MALEDYCASCTYMSECSNYDGKYYCESKDEGRYACDTRCGNYCEAYSRSNYSRENMYENSREHMSSGCYITTALVEILGFKDNGYHLNKLRELRNRMQKNPSDIPLLLLYDQIGPKIATCLRNDPRREELSNKLFNNYITKAVIAIEEGNDKLAKDIYYIMTTDIAKFYNIQLRIVDTKDYEPSKLGHGIKRELVPGKKEVTL